METLETFINQILSLDYTWLGLMVGVSTFSSLISGGSGSSGDASKALKAGVGAARKLGQKITQVSEADQKARIDEIDEVIRNLKELGLAADDAFALQQSLIGARGDELSGLLDSLNGTIQATVQGYIQPEELRQLGSMLNQNIMQQVASGNPDLQEAFNITEIQGAESLPNMRASVEELQGLGRQLGQFDQASFDQRFEPALRRINQQFDSRHQDIINNMNRRGIRAGSTEEAYQNELLAREYGDTLTNAALQAQNQAEQQQVSEYNARQAEPANLLRISADNKANTQLLLNRYNQAIQEASQPAALQQQGVNTASGVYTTRAGTEAPLASERRAQTLGTAVDYLGLPTSNVVAAKAGTAAPAVGSAAGLGRANIGAKSDQYMQGNQLGFDTINTTISALGEAQSDENKKEIHGPVDDDEALGALRRIDISEYNFKPGYGEDPNKTIIGGMAQDMPDEVTNEDHTAFDPRSYLGLLTGALRSLDKRMQRLGV